ASVMASVAAAVLGAALAASRSARAALTGSTSAAGFTPASMASCKPPWQSSSSGDGWQGSTCGRFTRTRATPLRLLLRVLAPPRRPANTRQRRGSCAGCAPRRPIRPTGPPGRRAKMNRVRVLAVLPASHSRTGHTDGRPRPQVAAHPGGRPGGIGSCPPLVLLDEARERFAGRLDVIDHRLPCRFGVLCQDRFGDPLMLPQVLLQQPRVARIRRVARVERKPAAD